MHGEIKSALLVLEKDLEGRFPSIEKFCKTSTYVLNIQNKIRQNLTETVLVRYESGPLLREAYKQVASEVLQADVIFLSNSEGYIAKNVAAWLKRDKPDIKIVALQHGLFLLPRRRFRCFAINLANRLFNLFTGVAYFGVGFVAEHVDFYIVYNSNYKKDLINASVDAARIFVSSVVLKELDPISRSADISRLSHTCLFLLQPLSALGILSPQDEHHLIARVISWAAKKYERVLIKQHPYAQIRLGVMPPNCSIVDEPVRLLAGKAGVAISFFSAALNEMDYYGLHTIAVFSKLFKVRSEVYDLFRYVVSFDESEDPNVLKNRESEEKYYESCYFALDEIVANMFSRATK